MKELDFKEIYSGWLKGLDDDALLHETEHNCYWEAIDEKSDHAWKSITCYQEWERREKDYYTSNQYNQALGNALMRLMQDEEAGR